MARHPDDLQQLSSAALVQQFAEAAAAHGRAVEQAKARVANKQYDIETDVYRELRSRGPQAQRSLLTLLDHPDPHVRCSAAARPLEFAPDNAEPTLLAIVSLHGFVGFDAQMILDVWRKGELRFP